MQMSRCQPVRTTRDSLATPARHSGSWVQVRSRLDRGPQAGLWPLPGATVRFAGLPGVCAALLLLVLPVDTFAQPAGGPPVRPLPGRPQANPKPGAPKPGAPKPGAPKAAVPNPGDQRLPPVDKLKLPEGYVAPKPPIDAFTTDAEWDYDPFKDSKDPKVKREQTVQNSKYRSLLTAGEFASGEEERKAQYKLITETIKIRLAAFTLKANRETVPDLRQKIITELLTNGRKADTRQEVRQEVMAAILREVPELMKYHFVARLNGILLVTELNDFVADGTINQAAVPYVAAHDWLLSVVADANQLEAIRVIAANGLKRILTDVPDLKLATRYKIVSVLVKQVDLSRQGAQDWFQVRLIDALGVCGVLDNQDRQPVVVDTLARVLVDPQRPNMARVEAAYAFARLPLNERVDLDRISVETARLAFDLGTKFTAESNSTVWNFTLFRLYVVFRPWDEPELKRGWGLLSQTQNKAQLRKFKPKVDEVFALILPMLQASVPKKNAQKLAASLEKLGQFLATNPPSTKPFIEGGANLPLPKPVANSPEADVKPSAAKLEETNPPKAPAG
jgi:hypothetical protein